MEKIEHIGCVFKKPPELWQTAKRPYFVCGMNQLKSNLPWGCRNKLRETEDQHDVFKEEGFELGPILGHGTFSVVVMTYWIPFRQNVAVKIYSKKKDLNTIPAMNMLPVEIEMLKTLKHPNIVAFFGAWETKLKVYLVMELVAYGNLLEYLIRNDSANESQAKTWFSQIVSGIKYMHDLEVAHRDIKLENILLDMSHNVRITDFGFATPYLSWDEDVPNARWIKVDDFRGSTSYMAPEIILGMPYNPLLADVWAMGIVLYCILFGRFPLGEFSREHMEHMCEKFQRNQNYKFPHKISDECKQIFEQIFKYEGARTRSIDLLECDWLTERTYEILAGRKGKLLLVEANVQFEREERFRLAKLAAESENDASDERSSSDDDDYSDDDEQD